MRKFLLSVLLILWPLAAGAQTCPAGTTPLPWGVTRDGDTGLTRQIFCKDWNGNITIGNVDVLIGNKICFANRFPAADAGAKIAGCRSLLPVTGGTVDARGLEAAQTISSELLLNKANVTILFNPGATYTLPTTSGLQAGILVTADNVHLLGEGTIFQATKALADDFTDYWLVRVSDAVEEVSGFQSKGIDYRLTITGTTATEKRMGCLNLYAATTARGIVDFELAGNSCRTSAPDIGIMQKWYGFAVEGEDATSLAARIIKRGKIHHNAFHECDGRVIQVYHGQQIDVESNVLTDLAPVDTYGSNGIRFIGTDDSTIVDSVITIGSTGHGNCLYIGGVANIAGDESKNITVVGNTCVHRGAVGSGYGLHLIGLQDGTITSNTFVNVNATGATRGIKIENVAGLTNQDIFIASNRIRGFSAWQVDIGTAAVRTVVGVNYLGRTAAGLSQFLNDTGVGTRYLGWEYDKAGLITPNFIEVGANSAQSGNLRLPNTGSLRWRNAGATGDLSLIGGADDYLTSGVRFRAPGLGINRAPLGDDLIYFNNNKGIYWRNAAGTAEHWIVLTASDVFELSTPIKVGVCTFATLGTPAPVAGIMRYCSDCTIANPCAAAGTGAIAKYLNGVWVCN